MLEVIKETGDLIQTLKSQIKLARESKYRMDEENKTKTAIIARFNMAVEYIDQMVGIMQSLRILDRVYLCEVKRLGSTENMRSTDVLKELRDIVGNLRVLIGRVGDIK